MLRQFALHLCCMQTHDAQIATGIGTWIAHVSGSSRFNIGTLSQTTSLPLVILPDMTTDVMCMCHVGGGAATDSPGGGESLWGWFRVRGGVLPRGQFREHFADICWVGTRVHLLFALRALCARCACSFVESFATAHVSVPEYHSFSLQRASAYVSEPCSADDCTNLVHSAVPISELQHHAACNFCGWHFTWNSHCI